MIVTVNYMLYCMLFIYADARFSLRIACFRFIHASWTVLNIQFDAFASLFNSFDDAIKCSLLLVVILKTICYPFEALTQFLLEVRAKQKEFSCFNSNICNLLWLCLISKEFVFRQENNFYYELRMTENIRWTKAYLAMAINKLQAKNKKK